MVHGDYYALMRHGAMIIGEAWVRCNDCGTSRHWVEQLAKTPAFIRRMGERSAAEAALFAEAEREIREKVQEER
jgi:hypothetical protein